MERSNQDKRIYSGSAAKLLFALVHSLSIRLRSSMHYIDNLPSYEENRTMSLTIISDTKSSYCGRGKDGGVLGGTSSKSCGDSSKEDGVLDGALGGLGDSRVVIGDGVLAMGDFGDEAMGTFGGD
nr:hypothetical protein [Tanacetum cinerariifolium]